MLARSIPRPSREDPVKVGRALLGGKGTGVRVIQSREPALVVWVSVGTRAGIVGSPAARVLERKGIERMSSRGSARLMMGTPAMTGRSRTSPGLVIRQPRGARAVTRPANGEGRQRGLQRRQREKG